MKSPNNSKLPLHFDSKCTTILYCSSRITSDTSFYDSWRTEDSGKGKKREGKKSLLQVDGVVKSPMSMAYQVFPLVIEDFPTLFSATKSR